ncbi:glycosyltransferase [Chloroflexota bacterium]
MKNVLIIVHLPRASPRVEGLVRYISEYGWQPIILTGTTSQYKDLPARIIETPYRNALGFLGRWFKIDPEKDPGEQIKSTLRAPSGKSPLDYLFTLGGTIVNYPCPNKNWKPFALKAAGELLEKENIDAIISSSAPVTSHLIASELKKRYEIPWIADFRDLWSQNHNYTYGPIRRLMDKRLEVITLANADALVTISEPWSEKLRQLHQGKRDYTITNGFDPGEVNDPPADLTTGFSITHTGSIYQGKQYPSKLFTVLRELISDGTMEPGDVKVRFYGLRLEWLDKEIEACGLSGIVKQYGIVPRQEAIARQRESQVLLVINWEAKEGLASHQAKLFEYLSAQRPVLSIMGLGNYLTESILNETGAGKHAPTLEDIKAGLKELYQEYKLKGRVDYKGDRKLIDKYSYREMTKKFSEILNHLTDTSAQVEVKAG